MIQLLDVLLPDQLLERVRRNIVDSIRELQRQPFSSAKILSGSDGTGVLLLDGVPTPVAHGLGRIPSWVGVSCIRGAAGIGRVDEIRDGSVDRTRYVLLTAIGYGAPIRADLAVL